MSGEWLALGAVAALAGAGVLRRGSRAQEAYEEESSLAEDVYRALIARGAVLGGNGYYLHGPPPLKGLILSDAFDSDGDPVIWINWIEGSSPGASAFLEGVVREVADEPVSLAGETQFEETYQGWIRRGYWPMSEEDAGEIHEGIDSGGFYFIKVIQ